MSLLIMLSVFVNTPMTFFFSSPPPANNKEAVQIAFAANEILMNSASQRWQNFDALLESHFYKHVKFCVSVLLVSLFWENFFFLGGDQTDARYLEVSRSSSRRFGTLLSPEKKKGILSIFTWHGDISTVFTSFNQTTQYIQRYNFLFNCQKCWAFLSPWRNE